ncbi:hypothetical protein HYDPIDRAFT_26792 [Hydnomerulius pinastri MD-312]|nr:hypothetical protein HYDPIDRAFT_26792 [Hydnomerulius pinastri MD-312]
MVMDGILYNPNTHLSGGEYEVNGLWACYTYNDLGNAFPMYLYIPRIVLSLLLCILPVIQFVRHSVEMRKALGTWRANRYMKLLAGQCILYFGVNLLANVVEPLGLTLPNNVQVPIAVLCLTLTFVLAPRFIISVRELHSRAQHVDSGFGLGTQRLSLNGEDMAFASVEETVE